MQNIALLEEDMTNSPSYERRKNAILATALTVFAELGYNAVTLQKIADRCKITRTTLYVYFRNKEDIFIYSIRYKTNQIEDQLKAIARDDSLDAAQKLKKIMYTLLDLISQNKKLLQVILPHLLEKGYKGENTHRLVKRNVIRLRHILSGVIITGLQKKELSCCNIKCVNSIAISIIMDTGVQIALAGTVDMDKVKFIISSMVDEIKSK